MIKKTGPLITAALVAALVLTPALPAAAVVLETGTKTCAGSTPFAYTLTQTKGERWILPAGGTLHHTTRLSNTAWSYADRQGGTGGGYWQVQASHAIDNAYTRSLCRSFG